MISSRTSGGWLACWHDVCKRTKATNGVVFVLYNSGKKARFGEGGHKGWFDGGTQPGELLCALPLGISFAPCPSRQQLVGRNWRAEGGRPKRGRRAELLRLLDDSQAGGGCDGHQ